MHRALWLLFLVLCASPLAAQDKGAKDEDAEALFQWEVKLTKTAILVLLKAKKLPNGTKMRAAIRVGDWAVVWKRGYVMQGACRFSFPRKYFRSNTYNALVLYQYRGQIGELAKVLKKFPAPYSRTLTFRLGTAKAQAAARLEETKLTQAALTGLEAHLQKGEDLFAENEKLRKAKKYSSNAARAAYEKWIAESKKQCGALKQYSDRFKAHYRPKQVDAALNLFRVAERFGKALYRAELKAMGVKRIPRGWEARGMLSTPPMIKQHIERELPPLVKLLEQQLADDNKAALAAAESD